MFRFAPQQSKVESRKSKAFGFWAACDSAAALDLKSLRPLTCMARGGV